MSGLTTPADHRRDKPYDIKADSDGWTTGRPCSGDTCAMASTTPVRCVGRQGSVHDVWFAAGPPSKWRVTMKSGSEIELWADAFGSEPVDGYWEFHLLVDATADEQREVRISSETVPPSTRCGIVIARVPAAEVELIESAI